MSVWLQGWCTKEYPHMSLHRLKPAVEWRGLCMVHRYLIRCRACSLNRSTSLPQPIGTGTASSPHPSNPALLETNSYPATSLRITPRWAAPAVSHSQNPFDKLQAAYEVGAALYGKDG